MITNTAERVFDVIQVTNEMPLNRVGGVGTAIASLMSGFRSTRTRVLWFLTEHSYQPSEVNRILAEYSSVAVGKAMDLRRFEAPVVHIHCYTFRPELMAAIEGMKIVFTIHSLIALEERSNDVDLAAGVRSQEAMIAASDQVVVISEAERCHYAELGYERLNHRATVIHNGVPTRPPRRKGSRGRVLGFSGRLVPRKHPEYVQMVLLENGFESHQAVIAGKAFSTYARDLVRMLGLEERVRYLGWCGGDRLEAFYDAIDVLAVPSIYEPFGLSALEAAARGIPVVCGRVDGLGEVLGEYAFYSEGEGYEEFRDAMRRWRTADGGEIEAIVAGARARQQLRFTDVRMARRYVETFEELLRGR